MIWAKKTGGKLSAEHGKHERNGIFSSIPWS